MGTLVAVAGPTLPTPPLRLAELGDETHQACHAAPPTEGRPVVTGVPVFPGNDGATLRQPWSLDALTPPLRGRRYPPPTATSALRPHHATTW
jgi:hypothetical protein